MQLNINGSGKQCKDSTRNTPHVGQLNTHVYRESMGIMRQRGNQRRDKHECKNQTQNQEMITTTRSVRIIKKPDRLCDN